MSENNNSPTQEEIANLARKFWEEEGQPEGQAEEHWRRAEEQLCPAQSDSPEKQSASS